MLPVRRCDSIETGSALAQAVGRESVIRLRDGRDLAVCEFGDPGGQAMVMFHGTPGSRLMFAPADAPARELSLRLICPDRPGIGRSSPHPGRSLASFVGDFDQVLDGLGVDRFILFGVSGGAPYATVAAARWRERVSLLALVSPMGPVADTVGRVPIHFGHRTFFLRLGQRIGFARAVGRVASRLFLWKPQMFHRQFAGLIGGPDRKVLLQPHIAAHVERDIRECLRQGVDAAIEDLFLFGRPWDVRFADITAPTVLWQGTVDTVVPEAVSLELARLIPGTRVNRVDGAGHFWIYDNVRPVLDEIADMVRGA